MNTALLFLFAAETVLYRLLWHNQEARSRELARTPQTLGAATVVARVSNLLYRRLPVGWVSSGERRVEFQCALEGRGGCGLEIRDTADWKSALRSPCSRRSARRREPAAREGLFGEIERQWR
jgi:hypothetical protein